MPENYWGLFVMNNTAWTLAFLVFFGFGCAILLSKAAQLLALAGAPSVIAGQLMLLLVLGLGAYGLTILLKG